MTWEELKKQQHEEFAAYWKGRGERQSQLRDEQQEALKHITVNGPKGHEYLLRIFREQNVAFMDQERDELDRLLFYQECERKNFFEKEVKRNSLLYLLNRNPDKEKDRGR